MSEPDPNSDLLYSFDKFGNLYLDFPLNKQTFQIDLDKNGCPVGYIGEYTILDIEPKQNKLFTFDVVQEDLDIKMDKELNEELVDLEEDSYIIKDLDDESDSSYNYDEFLGIENKEFIFGSNNGLSFPVLYRDFGDVCALYDTYIYKDSIIEFISKSSVNPSPYRIKIYLGSNCISVHTVGQNELKYKINYLNGDLQFIKM